MNAFRHILTGLLLFFTIFFICRRLLALAAVVYDAHARFRRRQQETLASGQQDRRYMPLSVLLMADTDLPPLLATLDSLQKQTYPLYEILILSNGMADSDVQALTEQLALLPLPQPVRRQLKCTPETAVFESCTGKISLRLIRKPKTSLGDAWNLGINVARYPYFACIRAGMELPPEGLDRLMDSFFRYGDTVAAGGSLRNAGSPLQTPLTILEHMEFDSAIPPLQTLLRGRTLWLCGGPAVYRKDAAIEAGGFPARDVGTDMGLTLSLQRICREKGRPCRIAYVPEAVGFVPPNTSLSQICTQRRLWQQGSRAAMRENRKLLHLFRYGTAGLQYVLFAVFSTWAPLLAALGAAAILLCLFWGLLDIGLLLQILLLSLIFKLLLSLTVFQTHGRPVTLPLKQLPRFLLLWLLESTLYRLCVTLARIRGLFA